MTRPKTNQLVREIAVLFTKYGLNDWIPIISELRLGSPIQNSIAEAIEELAVKSPKPTSRNRKPAKRKPITKKQTKFSLAHEAILESLQEALVGRRMLTTASSIKEAFYNLGIKTPTSNNRLESISILLIYLDSLTGERFESAVKEVYKISSAKGTKLGSEYERWFDVITKS